MALFLFNVSRSLEPPELELGECIRVSVPIPPTRVKNECPGHSVIAVG